MSIVKQNCEVKCQKSEQYFAMKIITNVPYIRQISLKANVWTGAFKSAKKTRIPLFCTIHSVLFASKIVAPKNILLKTFWWSGSWSEKNPKYFTKQFSIQYATLCLTGKYYSLTNELWKRAIKTNHSTLCLHVVQHYSVFVTWYCGLGLLFESLWCAWQWCSLEAEPIVL